MSKKLFKVRDKATQKFWNGDVRCTAFNETGKTWKKRENIEDQISFLVRYRAQWGDAAKTLPEAVPDNWEVVEIELKEVESGISDIAEFMRYTQVKNEVSNISASFGNFMDVMRRKKVINDIQYLIELKPAEGAYYVDGTRTMEARAHLRQLGVKTRTFREHQGVFGMMDRQQALRAKMVLDVKHSADLSAIRTKLFG